MNAGNSSAESPGAARLCVCVLLPCRVCAWGNYTRMRHVNFGVREYIFFFFVWDYEQGISFSQRSNPQDR